MTRLSLAEPRWLLALPTVWLVLRLARAAPRPAGRPRFDALRAAAWARATAVGCLVLALAGPRWAAAGRDVDVAFLVDASDSVGGAQRAHALAWVQEAMADKGHADRAALGLFGRDARLEHALTARPPGSAPATVVDGSATDLARAVRLGQGVLGSHNRRRVVLLTDGRATDGDLAAAAADLADAGVGLDVVRLPGAGPGDVLVEEVRAPGRVRQGESYDLVAVLYNRGDHPADGVLTVTGDGAEVDRRPVTLPPGRSEVTVARRAEQPGTVRYEARLASGASSVPANDVGRAAVRVDGPPRVLLYERLPGLGGALAAALRAAGVPTDVASADAAALPALDALLGYDSVVLVDVPADTLGAAGMATLDAYVRDAGRGLVAVGGEASFGLGGYDGTPLEGVLPVFARVTDPQRRPSVAEALVVDTSGSMAACHCAGEGFGEPLPDQGGVDKTEIAKEAVARAVSQLEAQDQVGVLAFNTASRWVIPLQQLPDQAMVDAGLARLHPAGDTDIPQAVREAMVALRDADARLRHIVLFTDGFMSDLSGLAQVAAEARAGGITVSVVATGEGATESELRRMAEAGGGRFYPGRDLLSVPDIVALELRLAARPIANEGVFAPVVTGLAPATERLDVAPPLLGYLATTAKPAARTLLAVGDQHDPLLATWQAGLGTAVAWTSDVAARWSAPWLGWERFERFWADVVKATFPARADPRFALSTAATADGLEVALEAAEDLPAGVEASATVTGPDGQRRELVLDRTGLDRFQARLAGGAEGVYAVSAQLRDGDELLWRDTAAAIRSYAPEYAAAGVDSGELARAVQAARGRLDPAPAQAFGAEGLAPGATPRELWPALALCALVLAPVDVGLRRLRLERADWARFRAWLAARPRPGRRRRPPPRDAATDALLAAKARARRRPPPGGG